MRRIGGIRLRLRRGVGLTAAAARLTQVDRGDASSRTGMTPVRPSAADAPPVGGDPSPRVSVASGGARVATVSSSRPSRRRRNGMGSVS
jgi:hypothetical protein